jgi:hypothetical protein
VTVSLMECCELDTHIRAAGMESLIHTQIPLVCYQESLATDHQGDALDLSASAGNDLPRACAIGEVEKLNLKTWLQVVVRASRLIDLKIEESPHRNCC